MENNTTPTHAIRSASQPAELVGDHTGLGGLLNGIAALPQLQQLLEAQARDIRALRDELKGSRGSSHETADGWIDAPQAAKYLDMCPNTFAKFRDQIQSYKVGGKILFKKRDLDNFVMLWEHKSCG